MKKLITAMLVLALALSLAGTALASSVNVHIFGNCNVRSSPSLSGKILGSVSNGTTLKGSGKVSTDYRGVEWYNVTYKGKNGWVSSKYSYISGGSSKGGSDSEYVTGDTGKSNVHTGPGLDYKIIGVLHQEESARFLDQTSVDSRGVKWYKISWNGQGAWVSSRYTRLGDKSSSYSVDTVIADGGDCHVRSGPGLGYSSIGVLYEDEGADYLNVSSTDSRGVRWYKISWNGGTGWVSSRYASLY